MKQKGLLTDFGFTNPISHSDLKRGEKKNMTEEKQKPKQKYRSGGTSIAVWENERKNKDGDKFTVENFTLQKQYTEDGKEWKDTNSYTVGELSVLRTMIDKILSDRIKTE